MSYPRRLLPALLVPRIYCGAWVFYAAWAICAAWAFCTGCASPAPTAAGLPPGPLRAERARELGGDRDCDLLHLDLDLTLDLRGRRLYGTATHWLRALVDRTREVRLFAVDLDVDEITDARGRALAFRQEGPELVITLASALPAGTEESLRIGYTARPRQGLWFGESARSAPGFVPTVSSSGSLGAARHWVPCWDAPGEYATLDLALRVEEGLVVIGPGRPGPVERHPVGEQTFTWRVEKPAPAAQLVLAVGRWDVQTLELGPAGEALRLAAPRGVAAERVRAALGRAPEVLAFLAARLGSRPGGGTLVVAPGVPAAGVIARDLALVPEALLADAGADPELDPATWLARRLAGWWLEVEVDACDAQPAWLGGALGELCALDWLAVREPAAARLELLARADAFLARADQSLPVALDWRTRGVAPGRVHHLRDKAPWALDMLRAEVGAGPFWGAVAALVDGHRGGGITGIDLVRALRRATGRRLDGHLQQWILGGGAPELGVSWEVLEVPGTQPNLQLNVRQEQALDGLVPLFDVPLTVALHLGSGRVEQHVVRVDEASERVLLPLCDELVDVVVDPDGALLAELRVTKPNAGWRHQARCADQPAAQWRAIGELANAARSDSGGADGEASAQILFELATGASAPRLRVRAIGALPADDPRTGLALRQAVLGDADARVRLAAARALLARLGPAGLATDAGRERFFAAALDERSAAVAEVLHALLDPLQ